jgi:hypothetical protein
VSFYKLRNIFIDFFLKAFQFQVNATILALGVGAFFPFPGPIIRLGDASGAVGASTGDSFFLS